jgi:anti-anti-sigma factor
MAMWAGLARPEQPAVHRAKVNRCTEGEHGLADATVDTSWSDCIAVIDIAGQIDHMNAEAFRDDLTATLEAAFADNLPVALDLGDLDYISSAGLRVFMIASKAAKEKDRAMAIAGWSETVKEIFMISRFNLLFDCFDTLGEASSHLTAS